ncbi:methylated-DNA--[protein]-cysteine S-methyltransferase [Nostoc sp. XA013]|nr:methylated-DNA--[protein]-cysteine S-methyltransferase [Nostoc sp. XA013]
MRGIISPIDSTQQAGKAINIVYAIAPCPLGYLLVATTEKGICAVKLGDKANKLEHILNQEFHQAQIMRDDHTHKEWIQAILNLIAGDETHLDLPLDVRGTAFQKQVWQALQKIPYSETRTYTDIARDIAKPLAVRAVGNACGANPTALIVPCHRVLRNDGSLGGYRWGIERKQKLLIQELKRTARDLKITDQNNSFPVPSPQSPLPNPFSKDDSNT